MGTNNNIYKYTSNAWAILFYYIKWNDVWWLKLPAWKVGGRGFEPYSGLQDSNKQIVSSPFTRNDSILWRASVTERQRAQTLTASARLSNSVSEGQCHLIHLTILGRFSWPSSAYMCTKVV